MQSVYYPITQYHLFLSQIVRKKGDAIVLDEKIFPHSLVKRIVDYGGWDQTFVIKRKKGLSEFFGRFILKSDIRELLQLRGRRIVFFSYGYRYCVFVVNLLSRQNDVIMMEDGSAPYYMSDLAIGWHKACESIKMPYAYVLLWWANNIKTDSSFVSSLEVFDVRLLSGELKSSIECRQIELSPDDVEKKGETINKIFDYRDGVDHLCYDIVYFDTDFDHDEYRKSEFETLCRLFSAFEGKRVLVKLRICGSGELSNDRLKLIMRVREFYSDKMVIDVISTDIPWEIAYMNNKKVLMKAVFVCMGISTVMLTPHLFFGLKQMSVICQAIFLTEYFCESDLMILQQFVQRVNQVSASKIIHVPETLSDLYDIVGKQ